jgi:hypothetical protein
MINPFFIFCLSGISMLLIYLFGWSEIYSSLSFVTFLTFSFALGVDILLGLSLQPKLSKLFFDYRQEIKVKKIPIILIFIFFGFIVLDFLYAGQIPILNIISGGPSAGENVKYLPVLHTFIVLFSVFLAQYVFHYYIKSKSLTSFLLFLSLAFIYPLLLGGRGILFVNIAATLVGFIILKGVRFNFTSLLKLFALVGVLGFIFGILGEIRSTNSKVRQSSDLSQTLIYQIAKPTSRFEQTGIDPNFLWPYIYVVSPLGNLDNLLNTRKEYDYDLQSYFVSNYFPNFIQKYLIDEKVTKDKSNLVVDMFNTYTAFGKSFQQFGWLGLSLYFLFVHLVIFSCCVIARAEASSIIMIQFLTVGHALAWFSNLYVKEVVIGPVLIGLIILLYKKLLNKNLNF